MLFIIGDQGNTAVIISGTWESRASCQHNMEVIVQRRLRCSFRTHQLVQGGWGSLCICREHPDISKDLRICVPPLFQAFQRFRVSNENRSIRVEPHITYCYVLSQESPWSPYNSQGLVLGPFCDLLQEISIPTSAFHCRTPVKFKRPAKAATTDQQLLVLLDFRLVVLVAVEMSSSNSVTG
jgi:hypothetical protein